MFPFLSPELPKDEAGWFHTADRVARLDERRFRLIGRAELMVKVTGKRVDLDAVRSTLAALLGVAEALMVALPRRIRVVERIPVRENRKYGRRWCRCCGSDAGT